MVAPLFASLFALGEGRHYVPPPYARPGPDTLGDALMRFRSTRLTACLLALTVGGLVMVGCGSDSVDNAATPIAVTD